MKVFNKYQIIGAGLLALLTAGTGCKKDLNINQDPDLPTLAQGTPALVFPVGVLATTGKVGGDLALVGGMWGEYFTQAALSQQYTDIASYNIPNTDGTTQNSWDVLYTSGLENYQYVITQANTLKDWNFYLLGTVMKAYTTAIMVDLYNTMPYTQSLQGQAQLNPKFDDGYTIYTSILSSIDTALSKDFTASTVTDPTHADLVFAGDMGAWKAFANTLKLKLYLRMVNAHPDVAQAGITALINSGAAFIDESTSDAAVTNFTNKPGQDNPLWEQNIRQLNTAVNLRASKTFTSWLEENSDPRIKFFFGSTTPVAINQGDFRSSDPTYPTAAVFVESPTDPVEFLSVAESYFLQAEADIRYFGGSKAQGLYESGVKAAFAATANDATTFLAPGGAYAWGAEMEAGAPLDPLSQVLRQKWASFAYGCHQIEGFFDENRTGFPVLSPYFSNDTRYVPGQFVVSATSVLSPATALPQRLPYPYNELSRNTNAPAASLVTDKIWWAK